MANFELILKILGLAQSSSPDVKAKLIENSLENCISTFDGFARERCSDICKKISFQNIKNAKEKLESELNIDITEGLDSSEWTFVVDQFQKRHLLAHKMGVIDEEYLKKTDQSKFREKDSYLKRKHHYLNRPPTNYRFQPE